MTTTTYNPMTCYGRTAGDDWVQEWYETASRDATQRARQLRKAGYTVRVSAMGAQVTNVGAVKMTLVDIRAGQRESNVTLIPYVRLVRV